MFDAVTAGHGLLSDTFTSPNQEYQPCDARQSEQEIRKKLLQAGAVDVMISIGPNFFYTVTLPCTLWFLDRGKAGTGREKTVLFIIPWSRYWVIGTTDTAYHGDLAHPVAEETDIDYVLEHANQILADPLTREDVIGTWAGLRPLLQPTDEGTTTSSTKVSREHTVTEVAPGLISIAGGKLTTYRVMAEDAVSPWINMEAQ